MSDPFDALGGLGGLLSGVTDQMKRMQDQAGGGLVKVVANGAMQVVSVSISEDAMDDRELLEDLVRAATSDALRQAQDLMKGQAGALAASLGLPPGLL